MSSTSKHENTLRQKIIIRLLQRLGFITPPRKHLKIVPLDVSLGVNNSIKFNRFTTNASIGYKYTDGMSAILVQDEPDPETNVFSKINASFSGNYQTINKSILNLAISYGGLLIDYDDAFSRMDDSKSNLTSS